jgi:two-component system, NarL family, sensor histidine kinase UhpB
VQPVSAVTSVQPAAPRWRPLLRGLWRGRSVRAQLLLVLVLIDMVAVIVGGSVAVLRARSQARVETTASMGLAEALVRDAIALAHQQIPAEQFLANLPVQLRSIRHVRIAVRDASGIPIGATSPAQGTAGIGPSAPGWFAKLVALPIESRELPVIINGIRVGDVQIVGEPGDEIAEFWENAVAMALTVALLNVAMVGILYILFGRVLDPLTILAAGLSDLKRQSYDVRMPKPQARELAVITDHFNALARSLEAARTDNVRLNRRLVTAQDDERRRTALELHDEVGPCLFGLKANASSIASAAAELPEQAKLRVAERLRDTVAVIDHLQAINRSMLERLRPMALGHVPLVELIHQLVRDYDRRHSQIAFSVDAEGLQHSYGDSIDLTVYRCVQEGLTNAVRHAHPRNVMVGLRHNDAESQLTLTVRDDGRGIYPGKLAGFGMRGMRERVEGMAGCYAIDSRAGAGTCVRVTLPLAEVGYAGTKSGMPGAMTT